MSPKPSPFRHYGLPVGETLHWKERQTKGLGDALLYIGLPCNEKRTVGLKSRGRRSGACFLHKESAGLRPSQQATTQTKGLVLTDPGIGGTGPRAANRVPPTHTTDEGQNGRSVKATVWRPDRRSEKAQETV
jgi:hypothetical protein